MKNTFSELVFISLSLLFLIGAGCLACITPLPRQNVHFDVSQKTSYYKAVVMVHSVPTLMMSAPSQGTAFAITEDLLFTAGHVCESMVKRTNDGIDTGEIMLLPSDRKGWPIESEAVSASIVHFTNDEQDICLLKSIDHGFPTLTLSKHYDSVSTGDSIITIGCPKGLLHIVEDGRIATSTENVLFLNLHVEGGNSGSPVLLGKEVIGMVVSYYSRKDGALRKMSNAVPVVKLQEFLNKHGE